jgi:hypothetical protein
MIMNIKLSLIAVAVLAIGTECALAQAPAGSTGLCKDGTYTTAAKKRGSCNDHGGVKAWFGTPIPQAAPASPAAPPPVASPQGVSSPTDAAGARSTDAPQTVTSAPAQAQSSADSVKVWVNMATKVYHCPGSEWYGKTQSGKFITQGEAIAMGARAAYYKPCPR